MSYQDISKLSDDQKAKLVDARWSSSSEVWDKIESIYKSNTAVYENRAEWLQYIPERRRKFRVQSNRIFPNTEAVINSLIANPPGINLIPARTNEDAQEFARKMENYLKKKYDDLNVKEVLRMGLRNLYFGRLLVIKAFWNPLIGNGGDFDYRALDPRKVRMGKYARKEPDTEFVIEEIEDNLCAVVERFPAKKTELMQKFGFTSEDGEQEMYVKNPDVKYKEAWINDYVIFKLDNIILDTIKNPYWDWDGVLVTDEEESQLNGTDDQPAVAGQPRRDMLQGIKLDQVNRQAAMTPAQPDETAQNPAQPQASAEEAQESQEAPANTNPQYKPYFFNFFDAPRKPYIFATIFNNENSPIGRTDMITLSAELQRGIDKRKMDIDENAELANGVLKVDASVMGKSDAQRIRFETKGIIWGKGVKDGVTREVGAPLPQMVFEDMQDSRSEIDNIMAASSAFRGEREGQETKAGRLALVQQSYLRLNELVQVVDYVSREAFCWGMQLAKTRYTEYHYAKWMGNDDAQETIEIIQDDFENGSEVTVIAGKTLPVDDEFKFEQAQNDIKAGLISPIDYFRDTGRQDPKGTAKNAFMYRVSPQTALGLTDQERAEIPPPIPASALRETIAFNDLPAAAQVQFLARMGINVTEDQVISSEVARSVLEAATKAQPIGAPAETEQRAEQDFEEGDAQQQGQPGQPQQPQAAHIGMPIAPGLPLPANQIR